MKMFISLVLVLTLFCKGVILTGPQYFPFPFYNYPDYDSDSQEIYRPIRGPSAFAGHGNGNNHGHGNGNNHGHGNGHNYGHGNGHNYGHGNGNNHGNSGHWPPGFGPGNNKKGHGPPRGGGGRGNQNGHGNKNNKEPPFPANIPTNAPGVRIKPRPSVQATTSSSIDNAGKGLIDVRFADTDTETRKKRSTNSVDKSTTDLQLRFNSLHQLPNWNSYDRNFEQFTNHYPRLATCVQKKFECIPLDECKTASYSNSENRFCRFGRRGPYVCCEKQKIEKVQNFAIKCGRKKNSGLSQAIIGGINVDGGGSYPWMTAIGENLPNGSVDWYCGGALINEKTVITAAHCISRRQADVVRVGETNLSINKTDENSNLQQFSICRSVIHPLFRLPQLYNDLALLFLDAPVQFTPFVRPICLSQKMTSDTPLAILTGWGQLSFASEPSPILQEVQVQVFNNTYCDQQYALTQASKRNFPRGVLETQLCAGDENGGKDACQGDSGAPLVAEEDEGFALIGIVSAGIGCGSKIFPGVYTRVASFTPWIFQNLD